ncbi:hypothetical protein SELR_pSRC400080 (plasmid) [Selenomonas ruminantium subsp. lactilytica TAM6421]|uniref:Uncharacterized protein n=1 Tax=Selenomonas ruminantium subsp. lactilytica (strain NBRC 103574 / TAM6421) TaxID=927704 RepID=I0GV72_SELRL|nr:hypothetical protein [Selenomonas ruminantium]BAL84659.1 hypothetical protein SELR_pSRC400080 [Selenomonas ruminantium subsp. lactilytica TAM6421]
MYCFVSWNPETCELTNRFGTKEQMMALYRDFVKRWKKDTVMEYADECGWGQTYEEILNDSCFVIFSEDYGESQCQVFKVKRTDGWWPALKLTISRWRGSVIRRLISFLKKYE